jgi:synaptobrevin family protein YKT6
MKLTAVAILLKKDEDSDPLLFGLAADLSNFGFFQRGSVKEVLVFVARTIAKR